ncbi:MAG: NnrS family protein [Rhodocyclaceae bacterium]
MSARKIFFSAPHRVMFFAGGVQTLLAMSLWAFDLGARYAGLYAPPAWPLPPAWLHAMLMVYGLFSFFIFGFLMTALPKWVAQGPLAEADYVPAFLLLVSGWVAFYAGLALPMLLPVGLTVVACGWLAGAWALLKSVRDSMSEHKTHAWVVLSALAAGASGLLLHAVGLAFDVPGLVRAATEIGLWGYLVPVFFTVTYRMLPFFSGSVVRGYVEYRSPVLFWGILAASLSHALAAMFDIGAGRLWPVDLVAALAVFWLAWRWQIHKVFVSHLLAMHHCAGLWLGMAFFLYALQGAAAFFGLEAAWGGRAPLHALTVGYFGSILIGMATRVTLGHSGRLISSDVWAWRLFWCFQGVALLRVGGEWAGAPGIANPVWLSALGWLLVFAMWNRVHLAMYVKPRPDGRPG